MKDTALFVMTLLTGIAFGVLVGVWFAVRLMMGWMA